eukprot:15366286-Ditylum_brightwellii.AAC.1
MQQTSLPIREECHDHDDNAHSAEINHPAPLPTQVLPHLPDLNGEIGSLATTLTDKATLSMIQTMVTVQLVEDGSVVGSVMSSGSGFLRAPSGIFLLTPVLPGILKITNIDEAMYDEGYDTD